jgi:hypothetical protein
LNAVEIEEAISTLAEQLFDAQEFPFVFLQAFGNKPTTIKKLRSGVSNRSDLGGVLQTNNIHLAVCLPGEVTRTLTALKASLATLKAKARFILATDGIDFEAEDLETGETVACAYKDFPNHFGFFLPLAGITTVKQVRESSFDIRATSRLNRLYVELLKDNPEWGSAGRRHDMNHFMARLVFCFFAEDTDIFNGTGLFTATIEQMSARDSSNSWFIVGGQKTYVAEMGEVFANAQGKSDARLRVIFDNGTESNMLCARFNGRYIRTKRADELPIRVPVRFSLTSTQRMIRPPVRSMCCEASLNIRWWRQTVT